MSTSIARSRASSLLSIVAAGAVAMAGALWAAPAAAVKTVRIAMIHPENQHTEVQAVKAFARYIEAMSGGDLKVQFFFGTMGGAREIAEQIQQGVLDYSALADGSLAGFFPRLQVFSIPYLFPSEAVAWNVFDGPFADKLRDDMRTATGLRVLGLAQNGFRVFSNNVRPMKSPADMKGVRIRTMESPVYMEFVKSLGATAVPMGFPELINSLQQGVVDGQENAPNDIFDTGIVRVQKYVSLNNHIMGVQVIVTNDKWFNGLTPTQKRIMQDGARFHATMLNALKTGAAIESVEKIKATGAQVYANTPDEKNAFRTQSQKAVRDYLEKQVGAATVSALLADVERAEREVYGAAPAAAPAAAKK